MAVSGSDLLFELSENRTNANEGTPPKPQLEFQLQSPFEDKPQPEALISVASPRFRLAVDSESDNPYELEGDADEAPICDDFNAALLLPDSAHPLKSGIGSRAGLSRKAVFMTLAIWHVFGGRCMLTLMSACLQLAHVIPVSVNKSYLRFLEWVFGDPFDTLFIHDYRNLWLLDANMHYAVDKGLIKIVPEFETLQAIAEYSAEVRRLHADKLNNSDVELDREKFFPKGLYRYVVVGILCTSDFPISRHRLVKTEPPFNFTEPEMVEKTEEQFGTSYQTRPPISIMNDTGPSVGDPDKLKEKHVHLKGYRLGSEVDVYKPLQGDPGLVLELPQDPWLVTANVGEFLSVLKKGVNKKRFAASMKQGGPPMVNWQVDQLVEDPQHALLLRTALQIYELWEEDKLPSPPRSGKTRSSRASEVDPSLQLDKLRTRKSVTGSEKNPAAGPSRLPEPTAATAPTQPPMGPPPVPGGRARKDKGKRKASGSAATGSRKAHREDESDNASSSSRSRQP
ncbi:hypothetical protein VNI00_008444 [Paramarasmius palmivorus]|uniref:HNH nuclease domain-containing protein n=1 Tax=Paramarasmius palmivorus TaxID=297713 RepID=A0AAW0CVK1_9AGAR